MQDPHVEALSYRMEMDSPNTFDNPPPRQHDTPACHLHLENGVLVCTMTTHYASAEEAKAVVEPFLHDWELDDALSRGQREFRFSYQGARIIDRDPPPPGASQAAVGWATISAIADVQAVAHTPRPEYPAPPTRFTASADVKTRWHRYEGYKQGRAELLPMAYFCLSFIEWRAFMEAGGAVKWHDRRTYAAKIYAIERKILKNIGDLSSEQGDLRTARKVDRNFTGRPLSRQETTWIDAAIRMLIRRVGERDADPTASPPLLTMQDLPPYSP